MNGHDDKRRANGVALNGQADPGYGDAGDLYGDYEDKLAQELTELLHAAVPARPGGHAPGDTRPIAPEPNAAPPLPQAIGSRAAPGHDPRSPHAAPTGREAFIPAARPYNDFVDDEMPPIPSTWRTDNQQKKPSRGRQVLMAGAGFASGLVLVVPLVLLLTGRLGTGPSLPDTVAKISAPASPVTAAAPILAVPEPVSAPAEPHQTAATLSPRSVRTETVLPEPAPHSGAEPAQPEPAKPLAAVEEPAPPPLQSFSERRPAPTAAADPVPELLTMGAGLVANGDIAAAREVYGRAAATGAPSAIMALAETFDPNMLAAWGARGDIKADTGTARMLYGKALEAGIDKARARLEALN